MFLVSRKTLGIWKVLMEDLKELNMLIDYVGHPAMNDDYLNKKRLDTLNMLIRTNRHVVIVNIGSIHHTGKEGWDHFTRYGEMFKEIKRIALKRSNVTWIDVKDDVSIPELSEILNKYNYTITPSTEINISGTNLSGCVMSNKQTSVTNFAELGFKVNIILPMCAEGENTGVNDLEKMMKAITHMYSHLKKRKLIDNVDLKWPYLKT
jgi:hypothetical protein